MKIKTRKTSRSWRFNEDTKIIENDIIAGNEAHQNFSVIGIKNHIGVIINCKKCGIAFPFTAKEQQHWYEKLKFWADSVPIHCKKCRGIVRGIVALNKRFSRVLGLKKFDKEDYKEIVDVAVGLLGNGVSIQGRLAQKVRMAAKRSNHPASNSILDTIKSA